MKKSMRKTVHLPQKQEAEKNRIKIRTNFFGSAMSLRNSGYKNIRSRLFWEKAPFCHLLLFPLHFWVKKKSYRKETGGEEEEERERVGERRFLLVVCGGGASLRQAAGGPGLSHKKILTFI